MSNEYYTPSGWPATGASGASSNARSELQLLQAAFDMLPILFGNGGKVIVVKSSGSPGLEAKDAVPLADTATNIAGGSAGSIPVQTASGTTSMLAGSTAGYVLTSAGPSATPTWTAPASNVGQATSSALYLSQNFGGL